MQYFHLVFFLLCNQSSFLCINRRNNQKLNLYHLKVGEKLKPMLLTAATEIPVGEDWLYEAKYDGFRCMLIWNRGDEEPTLISRNGNILNQKFPEIIDFCLEIKERIKSFLPLTLDGELVFLANNFQSNFSVVQTRGGCVVIIL